jgi:hypothetical protein
MLSNGRTSYLVDENGKKIDLLGINTKSQSSPATIRFQRYALQAESRKLLPKERVSGCIFRRITTAKGVTVLFNQKREKSCYGNLARCGSVWSCPVCAAMISEKRKIELKQGMDKFQTDTGGTVLLLTLTNSHNVSDSLRSLKEGQKKAMRYFWGNRLGKKLFASMGKIGHITAYEVTYGSNGWHPHHHILLFLDSSFTPAHLEFYREMLARYWIECCRSAKLPLPDMKHGLDLQDGSAADQYIQKWGLEDEMTKGHIKRGKKGGMTPFDLLRASREGDEQAGKLFQEFAIVFKGSRQLSWSRGLKELLGVNNDKTDQEIVDETDNEAIQDIELNIVQWYAVRFHGRRADILTASENDRTLVNLKKIVDDCVLLEIDRLHSMLS